MVDSTPPVTAVAVVGEHDPWPRSLPPHAVAVQPRAHDALVLSEYARHDLVARTLRVQGVTGAEAELALPESLLRRHGKPDFHDELDACDEVSAPAIANTILEGIVGYLWAAWCARRSTADDGDARPDGAEFGHTAGLGLRRGLDAAVETLAEFGIEGADVETLRADVERRVLDDLESFVEPGEADDANDARLGAAMTET